MISNTFNPERNFKIGSSMNGERAVHRVTFNPSSANPGDTIRVNLPSMRENEVFIPNSLKLLFQLDVDMETATNHTVFNVSRNLVDSFSVNIGRYKIFDLERCDLYEGYHDLLKVNENMMMGITSLAKRKTRAGTSDKSTDAKIVKYCNRYGKTYHIPLNHPIIDDHGCYNSKALNDKIEFELRLAKKGDVVVTTTTNKQHSYKLNNIEFEYATVYNEELANQISKSNENGRTFLLEDVHLYNIMGPLNFSTQKTLSTRINMKLAVMKGVLFLFTKTYAAGARNTEEFINPLISSVKTTINGTSNPLYTNGMGMKSIDEWKNILKKVGKVHKNFEEIDFHNDKYALWVDLRATQDNNYHGDGKEFGNNDGDGLVINITLESVETSVNCYIYTVSDTSIFVQYKRLVRYQK